MKDTDTFSAVRIGLASSTFLGGLLLILLVGSQAPFGISFADDTINTIQTVSTEQVNYQDIYSYERNFIGLVEARQISEAGFEIGGKLKSMPLDEGDLVEAGDVLAELDIARLGARRNEAEAELARAVADAKLAASTYLRFKEAREANAVSAQEKDEARESRDTTAATVKVAEARLQSILVDIEKSKLVAPFDGVIIQRMADEGAVVTAGAPVLKVQQNTNYDVRVGVSTRVAAKIEKGQSRPVIINGTKHETIVKAILPIRDQARTVDVIMELKHSDSIVRPGDIVRLPFEYEIQKRGFWISLAALKEGQRGLWSLYVATDMNGQLIAESRTVEVHYTSSEKAFVSGAVQNGDAVIQKGVSKLVTGQQIRIAM